jgi:large conductance mechanosensitive channel
VADAASVRQQTPAMSHADAGVGHDDANLEVLSLLLKDTFMEMIQEFKSFIQRGNVVDLAVGVIMGAAFGKIVNSVVADVLMPPIGYLVGGIKFTELKYTLPAMKIKVPDPANGRGLVDKTLEAATINYGNFLQTTFDFLIIAACVFLLVKAINSMKKKEEAAPAAPSEPTATERLLTEIRDALKAKA